MEGVYQLQGARESIRALFIFDQNRSKNTISEQYGTSRMSKEHFLNVFEKVKILKIFVFFSHFSHFHFSLFVVKFSENPVGQLSTWTRSKEMHWNQMTSIHKMKHLFAGYPSKNQSKKRESRKNCYCDIPGLYRAQSNKCAKMLISP